MSLIPEVREKIDHWLSGNGNRSVAELARRARVSYSATRRIVQDECEPSYTSLGSILSVVCESNSARELLIKQFPNKAQFLNLQTHEGAVNIESSLRPLESDQVALMIYGMVSALDKIEVKAIEKMYGDLGLAKVDLLQENGLVQREDDFIVSSVERFSVFDPALIKNLIAAHANGVKVENLNNECGLITFRNRCVTRDGYARVIAIAEKASADIKEVMDKCQGSVPIHFSLVTDSYCELIPKDQKGDRP